MKKLFLIFGFAFSLFQSCQAGQIVGPVNAWRVVHSTGQVDTFSSPSTLGYYIMVASTSSTCTGQPNGTLVFWSNSLPISIDDMRAFYNTYLVAKAGGLNMTVNYDAYCTVTSFFLTPN